MKKILSIVLVVLLTATAVFLGLKTDWYRDWNYFNNPTSITESTESVEDLANSSTSNPTTLPITLSSNNDGVYSAW